MQNKEIFYEAGLFKWQTRAVRLLKGDFPENSVTMSHPPMALCRPRNRYSSLSTHLLVKLLLMITLKKTFVNHILKFLIRFSANAALNSVQSIFATTIVIPAFFCYIPSLPLVETKMEP